jgi:predicted ABC-type ATPase
MDTRIEHSPSIVVVSGPNGAGKSTTAEALLKGTLSVDEFVNADVIARGLSGFAPEGSAVRAGRILLARIRELAERRASFAFETTLASRSFEPWLRGLRASGYLVHVVYLWLPSPDLAVLRVRRRVLTGGHDVPEETMRRRYERSLGNFLGLYRPLAASWRVYDNATIRGPRLVARGRGQEVDEIREEELWRKIQAARARLGPREVDPGAHDRG